MARHAADSYQQAAWYTRAADRLYSNDKLAEVALILLNVNCGDFQINHYQWIVSAPASELLAYAENR